MGWNASPARRLLALVLLLHLAANPFLQAQDKPPPPPPPERHGTAVVLDPSGYLATLLYLVEGEGAITVELAGRSLPAQVVAREKESGLALLRVQRADLVAVRLGSFESERNKAPLWILGVPAPPAAAELGAVDAKVLLSGPDKETALVRPAGPLPAGFAGAALVNPIGQTVGLLGVPAPGEKPEDPLPMAGCRALWTLRDHVPSPAATIPGTPIPPGSGVEEALKFHASSIGRVRFVPGGKPPPPEPLGPGAPMEPFLPRLEKSRARSSYANGRTLVKPVEAALDWLAAHASAGGSWSADHRPACEAHGGEVCGGTGSAPFDTGVTGLALQAFLGFGMTDRDGVHAPVVRKGLDALLAGQDAQGCFGGQNITGFLFNHGPALQAVSEALGCTGDPRYAGPAKAGVAFALSCQNPYLAWRYGVRPQDNDTAVTCMMVEALWSARRAGIEVDPSCFEGALAWLDKVTVPEVARVGYRARGSPSPRYHRNPLNEEWSPEETETLTAMGTWSRILCEDIEGAGSPGNQVQVRKALSLRFEVDPLWDPERGDRDFLYLLYGSLVVHEEGRRWKKWEPVLRKALEARQATKGGARGSWDPVDVWGPTGGRVYATAVLTLALETPFRYERPRKWVGRR